MNTLTLPQGQILCTAEGVLVNMIAPAPLESPELKEQGTNPGPSTIYTLPIMSVKMQSRHCTPKWQILPWI